VRREPHVKIAVGDVVRPITECPAQRFDRDALDRFDDLVFGWPFAGGLLGSLLDPGLPGRDGRIRPVRLEVRKQARLALVVCDELFEQRRCIRRFEIHGIVPENHALGGVLLFHFVELKAPGRHDELRSACEPGGVRLLHEDEGIGEQ